MEMKNERFLSSGRFVGIIFALVSMAVHFLEFLARYTGMGFLLFAGNEMSSGRS